MIVKNKKVLVIGDVMLDTYIKGEHRRQSPEADCAILNFNNEEHRMGGAANVALNLANLDQNPILIGVIGDDKYGHVLKEKCQKENFDYHFFVDPSRPTTSKTRFIDHSYKQYLRLDNEVDVDIPPTVEKQVIEFVNLFDYSTIDLIILQDYNKGFLTKDVIKAVQKNAKIHAIKLCVDPKVKNFKLLSSCDLFKPNLKELSHYIGDPLTPDLYSLNQSLQSSDLDNNSTVFITLSENGIYYRSPQQSNHIAGIKVENPDVSGAGDTVIAVLGILLISNLDIDNMAIIANKCGALVCHMKGISTINTTDLQQFI